MCGVLPPATSSKTMTNREPDCEDATDLPICFYPPSWMFVRWKSKHHRIFLIINILLSIQLWKVTTGEVYTLNGRWIKRERQCGIFSFVNMSVLFWKQEDCPCWYKYVLKRPEPFYNLVFTYQVDFIQYSLLNHILIK